MAKNSKSKKVMDEALGTISAALTILDKFPELSDINIDASVNVDPISFIMEVLYRTVGYDKVIEFIAKFLTVAIDGMEVAVKSFMILQLKDLFSCTVNPFISYDLIRDGIVFNLKDIDLINMLFYSPLENTVNREKRNGRWYYFGCEEFQFPDELKAAKDMNALIWYVKNRTVDGRDVWYGYKKQAESVNRPSLMQKQTKKDGIVTLEYNSNAMNLTDAEGNPMYLQTPFSNCLHVFLGNTKPVAGDMEQLNSDMADTKEAQSKLLKLRKQASDIKEKLQNSIEDQSYSIGSQYSYQNTMYETYIGYMDAIISSIDNSVSVYEATEDLYNLGIIKYDVENSMYTFEIPTGDIITMDVGTYYNTNEYYISRKNEVYDLMTATQSQNVYRDVKLNHYYHKTLFQFNADYIFSLKLFDSKTLAAKLIDALSGCLTIGADVSFEERVIQNEVDRIIRDIVDSDDAEVTDCFFSFSNEEYNELLERSELQRLGLYVSPDGAVGGQVDPETMLAALNGLSPEATKEEIRSAIEKSMFELMKTITPEYDGVKEYGLNMNLKANLIDNLLQTLANVIVMSVLTPKVYLLMLINLKILGHEPNFDLIGFLENFKHMIVGIIRSVRDYIIQQFKDWVMEIVGDLAKQIASLLLLEQAEYYYTLLRKCVECFKLKRGLIGWNMADVDYADIYETENNEPVNEEC